MDILTLVLFLVFVIVPVVNGLLQRGRGSGGQGGTKGQGRPPQGKTQTTTQTTRTTTRSAPAPTAQSRDEDSSFDRRLEEARRRVQEAMEGSRGGRAAQTSSQRDTTREEATTLFPTAPRPQPAQDARASRGLEMGGRGLEMGGQGLEGSTLNSPMSGASLTSTAAELARRGEAAPLRVQRRRGKKSATLSRDALMALDKRAVLRGLIWHQILSDPPSKHPHRRRSSQRR